MSALHHLIQEGQNQAQAALEHVRREQVIQNGIFSLGLRDGLQVALDHGLGEGADVSIVRNKVDVVDQGGGVRELVIRLEALCQRQDHTRDSRQSGRGDSFNTAKVDQPEPRRQGR